MHEAIQFPDGCTDTETVASPGSCLPSRTTEAEGREEGALFQAAPRGRAKASRHRPCPRSCLGPQGNGRFLGAETDAWRCIRTAALREDLTGAAPEAGTRRRPRGALGPTRPVCGEASPLPGPPEDGREGGDHATSRAA